MSIQDWIGLSVVSFVGFGFGVIVYGIGYRDGWLEGRVRLHDWYVKQGMLDEQPSRQLSRKRWISPEEINEILRGRL